MRQLLGVEPTQTAEIAEFAVGTRAVDTYGNTYIYCQAGEDLTAKKAAKIAEGFVCTTSGSGQPVDGVTNVDVDENAYFWLQAGGLALAIDTETGAAAGAVVSFVANTAGELDIGTLGANVPRGKVLTAEAGGIANVLLYALF